MIPAEEKHTPPGTGRALLYPLADVATVFLAELIATAVALVETREANWEDKTGRSPMVSSLYLPTFRLVAKRSGGASETGFVNVQRLWEPVSG